MTPAEIKAKYGHDQRLMNHFLNVERLRRQADERKANHLKIYG